MLNADVVKARHSKGLRCTYEMYGSKDVVTTPMISGTTRPEFNHSKQFDFAKVDQKLLDWFEHGVLNIKLYAGQEGTIVDASLSKLTTKEIRALKPGDPSRVNVDLAPQCVIIKPLHTLIVYCRTDELQQLRSKIERLEKMNERLLKRENRVKEVLAVRLVLKPEMLIPLSRASISTRRNLNPMKNFIGQLVQQSKEPRSLDPRQRQLHKYNPSQRFIFSLTSSIILIILQEFKRSRSTELAANAGKETSKPQEGSGPASKPVSNSAASRAPIPAAAPAKSKACVIQ